MNQKKGLHVGLVGLGFGAEFIPIYLDHPEVSELTICDSDPKVLKLQGDRFQVQQRSSDLKNLLSSPEIDAIHLITPISLHAEPSLAVLNVAKHCACTVPMATSIAELQELVKAQRAQQKIFMMMETTVFTRGFLLAREMLSKGEMGRIQLLKGSHYQDMEGWPPYWNGLPPFHYGTHAIAPMLAIANTRATAVHCFGSGVMREELTNVYGNPYPCETAIFQLQEGNIAAEATRTLFQTAREYTESFSVYGEHASLEWQQLEMEESPVVFRMTMLQKGRGRTISTERIIPPDRPDLLPESISRYTRRGVYNESNPSLSFLQGGGHHGSHPHMVHEFVTSIVQEKEPISGALTAANWTAAGICAHDSALQGGKRVELPEF